MAIEDVVREVAKALFDEADVRAVFGDPLKLDGHTVIPVSMVRIRLAGGGGGSAEVAATPVGFVCEEGGEAVFKPIALEGCRAGCRCREERAPASLAGRVLRRLRRR